MELTKWLKGIQGQCCAEREGPLKRIWTITIKSETFYEQYNAVNERYGNTGCEVFKQGIQS